MVGTAPAMDGCGNICGGGEMSKTDLRSSLAKARDEFLEKNPELCESRTLFWIPKITAMIRQGNF